MIEEHRKYAMLFFRHTNSRNALGDESPVYNLIGLEHLLEFRCCTQFPLDRWARVFPRGRISGRYAWRSSLKKVAATKQDRGQHIEGAFSRLENESSTWKQKQAPEWPGCRRISRGSILWGLLVCCRICRRWGKANALALDSNTQTMIFGFFSFFIAQDVTKGKSRKIGRINHTRAESKVRMAEQESN